MTEELTYKKAGVDIDKADAFVDSIRTLVKSTFRTGVLGDVGGFGGLFHLDPNRFRDPVLVAATDGVGTKLKVAILMGRHNTIGIDLVAMCVNDILVHGATPLFFLDYLAMGQLAPEIATQILEGIAAGCREARCALIGGETAEMPGVYQPGDYDLAGFAVGVVERSRLLDGSDIRVGDKILGLASSGLHANGFSLVRQVFFEHLKFSVHQKLPELGCSLGEELLKPTRIYAEPVLNLMRDLPPQGIAHITGGGLMGNVPRILPKGCQAVLHRGSWPVPAIFRVLQEKGNIPESEMWRTFNQGIGLVLVVRPEHLADTLLRLRGLKEEVHVIGEVVARPPKAPPVVIA